MYSVVVVDVVWVGRGGGGFGYREDRDGGVERRGGVDVADAGSGG